MINADRPSARQDDPLSALHLFRRVACLNAAAFGGIAAVLLAVGLVEDSIRVWNLGLTLIVSGAIALSLAGFGYVAEPIMRHLCALEVGERAIGQAIEDLGASGRDDDDDGDELGRRRQSS